MATVRYVKGGNYQNGHRRLKSLWEIARRLPPDRLKTALDAQDRHGWTALMYAAEQMDALGIALLLHLGATPGIPVDVPVSDLLRERMEIELGRGPVPAFSTLVNTLERPWS
jgi:ankyrin repeat protein